MLKPSADRLDNSKSYMLDNLRMVAFRENVIAGNKGKIGFKHSLETRSKISLAVMGNKNWMFRKKKPIGVRE